MVIRDWAHDYNTNRPHSALGYETPKAFAESLNSATDCHAAPHESSAQPSVANPVPKGVSTIRLWFRSDDNSVAGQNLQEDEYLM
ncbi:MAG: integrase core domain-containing protein [Paracoccaceae bacterium]